MKNFIIKEFQLLIIIFLVSIISSCSGVGDDSLPTGSQDVIPSNLVINITVVGQNTANPNGNGSGEINVTASASNTESYKIEFGDGNQVSNTSGNASHTYTQDGTNSYTIKVFATSSTGNSIGDFKSVNVYVNQSGLSLIWSDEFNTDGAPDTSKWGYDIGRGNNGWGNGESQYYTDRSDNVIVEDGFLKITAKKENYQGAEYTSTRLQTLGKFDFKYGVVEVRAKLPEGGGTWPAVWMLGSNFTSVGWPACGEVDIMEHVGNDQNKIHGTLHYPGNSGGNGNGNSTTIANVSSQFHVYKTEWTNESIKFFVDDVEFHSFNNSSNVPFNHNFFFILNVAMGGSFGGSIDSSFSQSTMEIDYIRVYQ
ncbi:MULTISPECIES: family 16 glycosylhydrolase [Tenacibaculum]|uniref:family 16 glycosylhydrolase n=1 Tax=Tenacibaculum TaxID=104267 RepID=UPI001F0AB19E|nr:MULTISPECIES: family 16 glycosylhydrolase [Tenacibaculum]MCH3882012.1 family 16 glycosylhydrolase [Tenacibaculum aquimarinum]MDO6601063.1 family 16 glycosylhydrolase [Tenacibaculum sp. 1_MG-2023]